jgi:phage tail-like protein
MLDVNGTRYHLVFGSSDWLRATDRDRTWEYDRDRQAVRLQAEIFSFGQRTGETTLTPDNRRSAAQDPYGHRYWIDPDGQRIWALWAEAREPQLLFPQPPSPQPSPGPFRPAVPLAPPEPESLAGLTVVADGYLVAGSATTASLLVFDLYSLDGGFLRIPLPEGTVPFDLEALPDGGLLLLDRTNRAAWRFNRGFRPQPQTTTPGDPLLFQPKAGEVRLEASLVVQDPVELEENTIALAPVTPGDFWALVGTTGDNPSRLQLYQEGEAVATFDLNTASLVEAGVDDLDLQQIRAYDLTYVPTATSDGRLYLVDETGNQAYSLRVIQEDAGLRLSIERQYYPLRSLSETALIAAQGLAYYRQNQRWLPLRALPQQRFEPAASLTLPMMDGRTPDCLWHRLCVDACLPPDAALQVEARSADTTDDLASQPYQLQPTLYRRSQSEVPYSHLWSPAERMQPHTGTWELLFQQLQGRYLQLRLTLQGNGRNTPLIRALRVHYPRFSYLQQYLPPLYQRDRVSASFLDRYLANPEGLFTTLEGAIAQAQVLLDPRTAGDVDLDWLAGWLGLALDPTWTPYQRRLLLAQAAYFCRRRGTTVGILQAVLLTVHPELGPAIFRDDAATLCNTVRVVEQFLTRTRPGVAAGDPTELEVTTTDDIKADAKARAHRFIVLLPTTVDERTRGLVERIVNLQKPAHTAYSIRQYWALFRVGEVRLGIDTVLGQGGRFETFRLGQTALAEGVLAAAFPYSLTNRTVLAQ